MKIDAGQVVVVTGGASGIGLALANAFGQRGLRVVISDVQGASLEQAVLSLEECGIEALDVIADVSDAEAVENLAERTLEHFGQVDIVCNNAGVSGPVAPIWEQELAAWRWHLDVMVMGLVHGVRSFVPHLIAQGSGHVLNTASEGGILPRPLRAPYMAAKHAVVGLTESLQEELRSIAPGVGASVLCPGLTRTSLSETSMLNRPSVLNPRCDEPVMTYEEKAKAKGYGTVQSAEEVALAAVAAVESRKLHVITNPDCYPSVRDHLDELLSALS